MIVVDLLTNTLGLYLDAAPWLLLGLAAAGFIKAWVPESGMSRWLGGAGLWPITKSALIGAPLPLCSCGVLPAALGLRRAGASPGSTVSFLIATPETGVDSVAITYALMGPFMAVARPVAAILSAIFTGLLMGLARKQTYKGKEPETASAPCTSGCCSATCAAPPASKAASRGYEAIRYASSDLVDDIAGWLALGLLLGGVLMTFLPADSLASWGSGPLAMVLMLLVGVPMYICATASTPLAAALLVTGISPGTVLVFLLAGPATNIATLALVRRELGSWATGIYVGGIAVTSIGFGLLLDAAAKTMGIDFHSETVPGAELIPDTVSWASAALLALAAVRPIRRRLVGF